MISRLKYSHNLSRTNYCRNWQYSPTKSLAQNIYIRLTAFIVTSEVKSSPTKTSLNFIRHKQYIICTTDLQACVQIAIGGDINPALALNRFHEERSCIRRNSITQSKNVTKWHNFKTRSMGTK